MKKKGAFDLSKKNRGFVQSALSSFTKSASTIQGDDVKLANSDQKLQYYLNIEKGTRPTDVVSSNRWHLDQCGFYLQPNEEKGNAETI